MILTDWTDHPQRLWETMENTLSSGVEFVIHVGPEPKLIPTMFDRLSSRVMKQLKSRHLDRLGSSVIPSIGRNHWLTRKLPTNAVLLRAPVPPSYHSGGLAARSGVSPECQRAPGGAGPDGRIGAGEWNCPLTTLL